MKNWLKYDLVTRHIREDDGGYRIEIGGVVYIDPETVAGVLANDKSPDSVQIVIGNSGAHFTVKGKAEAVIADIQSALP